MYEPEAQWGLNTPWTTGARHDAITECVRCSRGPRRALERHSDRMYLGVCVQQLQRVGGVV